MTPLRLHPHHASQHSGQSIRLLYSPPPPHVSIPPINFGVPSSSHPLLISHADRFLLFSPMSDATSTW
ncbi:hypothetical protein JAAARDRAFT_37185 [Jaapia argillacea MUCL 33604]|uniref:Uncharacterized protein n=1 Tax=Jaapia argillacea MUCL 33604 TaxID=933084 RepID=A0A067PLR0_9AGAM|nr:hypothetical protein JAAARDRAFT_37185 [Jaapia argillacea MUCL 33604]